jgi:hypothetical protein
LVNLAVGGDGVHPGPEVHEEVKDVGGVEPGFALDLEELSLFAKGAVEGNPVTEHVQGVLGLEGKERPHEPAYRLRGRKSKSAGRMHDEAHEIL